MFSRYTRKVVKSTTKPTLSQSWVLKVDHSMAAAWDAPTGKAIIPPNKNTHEITVNGRYFAIKGFTATR